MHPERVRLTGAFFSCLWSWAKFCAFYARDVMLVKQEANCGAVSQWDRYAAAEYARLASEEEDGGAAQQQQQQQQQAFAEAAAATTGGQTRNGVNGGPATAFSLEEFDDLADDFMPAVTAAGGPVGTGGRATGGAPG